MPYYQVSYYDPLIKSNVTERIFAFTKKEARKKRSKFRIHRVTGPFRKFRNPVVISPRRRHLK